jgi:hypothetical protein
MYMTATSKRPVGGTMLPDVLLQNQQPVTKDSLMTWDKIHKAPVRKVVFNTRNDKLYGIGFDQKIYKLESIDGGAMKWDNAAGGWFVDLAFCGDYAVGVGSDHRLYAQNMMTMNPDSRWTKISHGYVLTIAVSDSHIVGLGRDNALYFLTAADHVPGPDAMDVMGSGPSPTPLDNGHHDDTNPPDSSIECAGDGPIPKRLKMVEMECQGRHC